MKAILDPRMVAIRTHRPLKFNRVFEEVRTNTLHRDLSVADSFASRDGQYREFKVINYSAQSVMFPRASVENMNVMSWIAEFRLVRAAGPALNESQSF